MKVAEVEKQAQPEQATVSRPKTPPADPDPEP